jgi:uncharacterized FAD-dependent dehydrogenase
MKRIDLVVPPETASSDEALQKAIAEKSGVSEKEIGYFRLIRRSYDARSKQVKVNLSFEVFAKGEAVVEDDFIQRKTYPDVSNGKPVIIVGAGPAGLFAALRLIEKGIKPIIIERGKNVRDRRRDLAAIHKEHIVNPDSNYCFGEGGAGTYSDGKLYTRSNKRGDIRSILSVFVQHGATEEILIDAHPHIGTNKLPGIIESMRETILNAGGEIHFEKRVTDILIKDNAIKGVTLQNGDKIEAATLILATGHSARDIYELLHSKGILLEAKPFAMGVRVEHPQQLIDKIMYHCDVRHPYLPAAPYSAVQQVNGRGVYSFCMCPGGIIAPCATAPGEVVTNGWSPSKRNNPFANSGIVVSVEPEDYKAFEKYGPLAGMKYQQALEQAVCASAGNTQTAPAQRLVDFTKNILSPALPETSYQPGVKSVMLKDVLPPVIADRLREGFIEFGKKMRGYLTNDAVVVAIESRTSSPVRIPRNNDTLQHPQVNGLYPCGEGGGYAGGIVSAAMDGERCADKI